MNDSGEIIGRSTASGGSSPVARGYVWNPASGSQLRLLAGLGSEQRTNPMAINDAGQIVGSAGVSSDFSHAVRWEPPGGTVTSSVVATADTYANRAAPSTVFGFSSSLAAGLANSSLTYLRFNVPVAPAGRHLVAASLRLHTTTSSSSGSADALEVREASPFWSEAATTWNNRPTTGPDHLGDLAMVAANSYASIRLDQTKVTPGVPLNLVVNGNNADSAQFWSRSYGNTPYRPTLTLIYR